MYTSDVADAIYSGVSPVESPPNTTNLEWKNGIVNMGGIYNILKDSLTQADYERLESRLTNTASNDTLNPLIYNPALWYKSDGAYQDAACQFTASDKSWLQIADAAQTGLDFRTDDGLVCGWFWCDSLTSARPVFDKRDSGSLGYSLFANTDGSIQGQLGAGSMVNAMSAAGVVAINKWVFFAYHADRSGNLTIYVGDTATTPVSVAASSIAAVGDQNTANHLFIGRTFNASYYHDGRLDSLMWFKAADLSAVASDIIAWAYNSGAGRLCSEITAAQKTLWGAISGWELGEACYDAETEVLTENGWKYFCEVERGEKVATLDPNTGIMNYDIPLEYHRYWHDGDMFQQKSRSIDLCVTPNHTMYVRKDKPRIVYDKNDSLSGFEKIQAKDMPLRVAYKRDAKWIGIERDFFILPEFTKEYTCTKNQTITRRENAVSLCNTRWGRTDVVIQEEVEPTTYTRVWDKKCIPMDTWLKFFGIWLAEGYTSKSKSGHHRIGISQSETANPENCREIERVLDELGYAYCRSGDGYEINDIQLYNYLAQFGKSYNKFIPKDIKELSPRQLHILFYGLQLGDGWNRREGSWGYGTCSQKLADDIQEISLKMGLVSVVTRKPFSEQPEYILGRKKKSGHDFYSLCITTRSKVRYVNAHGQRPEWVKYTGNVYCLTVPTGLLYVRRNGKSCWCGNSGRRYDSWGSNHLDQAFAELVTNGTFTGNSTGWTEGAGWAYGTNNEAATAAEADLAQTTVAPTVGKLYSTSFVAAVTSGTLRLNLGGVNGTTRSTSATHTETMRATSTASLVIDPVAAYTGTVDAVSVMAADILPAPGIVRGLSQDSNFATQLNGQYYSYTGTAFNPGTGGCSLWCACYLDKLPAAGIVATLFSQGTAGAGDDYIWIYVDYQGILKSVINDSSGAATATSTNAMVPGAWYTVLVNVDRAGNITSYVNGSATNWGSAVISAKTASVDPGNMFVGRYSALVSNFFPGRIDNVGWCNRVVTAPEIAFLHNNGEWRQWSELGVAGTDGEALTSDVVKGFWEFDNASNLGLDSTSNANNLTPVGTPTQGQGINYLEGQCSYLNDFSGNSKVATQSTLAKRPSVIINALNGYKAIRFDGIDDYLATTLGALESATIIAVGKINAAADVLVGVQDTHNRSFIGSNADDVLGAGVGEVSYDVIKSNDDPGTDYFIAYLSYNGTNIELYKDGGLEYTGGQTGVVNTSKLYYLGALNNADTAASFLDGDIVEVLIFDRVLTRTERRTMIKYLERRYGITVTYT